MAEENNNLLFSQDELFEMESSQKDFNLDGPITILGMTFENDEKRLEYFRDELRKKLPELKKIDGYPIADDEAIIALSDPPFYTACPNPWLDELIDEWEKDKAELVAKKERELEKEVTEPYARDVSEGKSNPVYSAHTYHTKVPHPAIMRYILHYTEPGDIIMDGFAGTGMTGVAAQACDSPDADVKQRIENEWRNLYNQKPHWGLRHAICSDLSPYASSIAYAYNNPTPLLPFAKEAKEIIKKIEEECRWMYETHDERGNVGLINYVVWSDVVKCSGCGQEFLYWDSAMDFDKKQIADDYHCPHCGNSHSKNSPAERVFETVYDPLLDKSITVAKTSPVLIVYTCNGKRLQKRPDKQDLELIQKVENLPYKYFVASQEMPEGEKTREPRRTHGISHVHLYNTKRNTYALSVALHYFEQSKYSNILKFIFTGMVNRSSKMNRIHVNNFFYGGGGWNAGHMKGTLYVPNIQIETSILEQLDDKLDSYLRALPLLGTKRANALSVNSASQLPLKSDSIDYIFIDPPFGANIMYSELNFVVEGWLKVITNNEDEAIENRVQQKSALFYAEKMAQCFKEFYRVLKPGRWITIEFSNTKSSVWNSIQRALSISGFIVANVAALDKKQGGMRSITTSTAVRQDLVITCYKPSEAIKAKIDSPVFINIWELVDEHLHHLPVHLSNGKSTEAVIERSPKILYDRMISFFVEKGQDVPIDSASFQAGLRERYSEYDGMFFTAGQLTEYLEKKKLAPEFVPMGLIVGNEADGIEWLRNRLRDNPQTYQDIQPDWLQAIGGLRRGDVLPGLDEILDENFIQEPDGKWRLPNIQDDVDKDTLREKALLKEFKVYVDAASKPRARIKEVRVEAIRAGFKKCYMEKDFATIVMVGDKIPQNLLTEDDILLQFYDIARTRI